MRGRRATINDVGQAAGVSPATVSRVLNGSAPVDPALAERVLEAVRALGYRPNAAAQGLARGEWGTLGVLVPDLGNPYFPDVLKAISAAVQASGRRVMVMESDERPERERELAEDLMRCCDGVLLCSPRMDRSDVVDLAARRHPMVLVNRIVQGLDVPAVSVDFFGAMTLVCGHLTKLGHRRVAYLSGPPTAWANTERIRAFEAARAFGLDTAIIPCGATSQLGYDALPAALGTGATAVVTYNDLVAYGAFTRLQEMGVEVPDEVSLIGFDDLAREHLAGFQVTTVSVSRRSLGTVAAQLLVDLLAGRHDSEPRYLPVELQIRETCAQARV